MAPVVSANVANVVGTYFDAADAKEWAIVRIAYRDRFLAAAAALVTGSAVVALVAPRLCAFVGNRSLQVTPVDAPIGTLAQRAPQRRRAVARWTVNGAFADGDPGARPSSTPSREKVTVMTIYLR